jgi:glycosyltransferase involved in cell wall biosynthesis
MRIGIDAHTLGQRKTGNETYVRNLIRELSDRQDPDLDYVFYHFAGVETPPWRGEGRLVHRQPLVRLPLSFPWALRRDRVDVAHFQYVIPPLCPSRAVVIIHDISYEDHPEYFHPLEAFRLKWSVRPSARRAAHVLTLSEFSKGKIAERYGVPRDRITVTPAAASSAFRVLEDRAAVSDVLARRDLRAPYVLAVGNVQPRKNLERLMRAYARLRRPGRIGHDLVLVGQPAFKGSSILETAKALGIEAFVKHTGYVSEDELVALYNGADVFAYPSLYEGFGLPIVEAMACGAPVITSNVTSLPEVAGDAAILVDPRSEDEMAAALERLLTDAGQRARLRDLGAARARHFTWRKMAEETVAVYRALA